MSLSLTSLRAQTRHGTSRSRGLGNTTRPILDSSISTQHRRSLMAGMSPPRRPSNAGIHGAASEGDWFDWLPYGLLGLQGWRRIVCFETFQASGTCAGNRLRMSLPNESIPLRGLVYTLHRCRHLCARLVFTTAHPALTIRALS